MTDILDRLRKATGPDRDIDRHIKALLEGRVYVSFQDDLKNANGATPPAYTASLDAVLALVERVLPRWSYGLVQRRDKGCVAADLFHVENNICPGTCEAPTAPLALLIALFQALEPPHAR